MRSIKALLVCSSFFTLLFVASSFTQLEAAQGRFGAYNNSRPAWGGNGGSWGNNGSDWYGDNNYYYSNEYPYGEHYYGPNAGVDGSGYYLNIR